MAYCFGMDLFERVRQCRLCPGVCPGSAVLGPANGPGSAPILFVGEAPGRLGAARTGVPFHGDAAGDRFELLLAEAGLRRDEVFVTNAVLCLPLDERGRNRTPSVAEVRNCAIHLAATIDAVAPALVVALGATALRALALCKPHGLALRDGVGQRIPWRGRELTALYHPGARAQIHRPWPQQVEDWRGLGDCGGGAKGHTHCTNMRSCARTSV